MLSLKDTQNERDTRNIAIDQVGVRGLRYPIEVKDKANYHQSTVAKASLAVDLPMEYKGTHMSRFVEVLHSHGPRLDVHSFAKIPYELLERLDAQKAHMELSFPYFRTKKAPVSGREGLMDYEVVVEVIAQKGEKADFILTVKVPVTTLCPCSKALGEKGAHNQRGVVTYSVRFAQKPIWIEDLIDLVEACASCSLYSILKRPDEKWVTDYAYEHPVFVEDLVRNIAQKTESHEGIFSWYRIEAENYESIHNHEAYAIIERQLQAE